MIAVIQEVRVDWTKESRSGLGAAARNAVRRVHPLPRLIERAGPLTLALHNAAVGEDSGFRDWTHELVVEESTEGRVVTKPGMRIRVRSGVLTGTWAWEFSVGAPERSSHPVQVLTLGPGEWGQIRVNGRLSSLTGMAGWTYLEWTVNLGLMAEPRLTPFVGDPTKTFESLSDLR